MNGKILKMRYNNIKLCLLILVVVFSAACSKKIVPSELNRKSGKEYDSASFNYIYVEAVKQKLLGNSADALKYFEQSVLLNPRSDASYYQMAQIVLANGDMKNGKKYVHKAISIDDKNLWYLMIMAGIYYQQQSIDSAIIYYKKAADNFPDKEKLQLTLGNLYSEKGDYQLANEIFDSLDKKFGVNELSTIASVKNHIDAGEYDEAFSKTRMLLEKSPDEILYNGLLAEIYRGKGEKENAMEVYSKLIERNPDNAETQLAIIDFLITEKSYDELFTMLNTVIINSNVSREDKISVMARLIEMPDLINSRGDNILIALMVMEASYNDDVIVPLLRPELLINQNKYEEAAARLEEIILVNPDNYYAWEKLLLVYLKLKDYKTLMVKAEKCATRFNRSFLAKILYANAAIENQKYDIALDQLRRAEILGGTDRELQYQVITLRADTYYRMKEYSKAFEIFDSAVKANSDDLTILNNYAYYLAEQDVKLKEAEVMAKKVIDIEKDNTTFLDTYAWVLYKRGKNSEAARIMEQIINKGEEPDAEWFEHYGYILKKQKKCDKAIENWKISIELDASKTYLLKEIENCKK